MRPARLAALAALSSLALFPSVAKAGDCWLPNEAEAAQVRGLQLMLMVGTLQCRTSHGDLAGLYNDFVEQQRPVLVQNAQLLKNHFQRENGMNDWQSASDRFETSLSNLYSAELDDGGYCATIGDLARDAADASWPDLLLLSQSVADAPVSGVCQASDPYGRAEARRVPPKVALTEALRTPSRAEKVAIAAVAAAPAPAAPVAVEAAATMEPAPVTAEAALFVAEEAATVEQTSLADEKKADVVAAAAAPTKDDALNAAIVALQSAVTALQAASAPKSVAAD